MDDERLEATSCLRFDPVLENEAQDSTGHLEETVFAFCLEVELYEVAPPEEGEWRERWHRLPIGLCSPSELQHIL